MVQNYLVLHFCSDAEKRMLVVYNHPVTKCKSDILLLKKSFRICLHLSFALLIFHTMMHIFQFGAKMRCFKI